jgi:hypothetical protein
MTPVAGSFRLYGGTITGVSSYSYPTGTATCSPRAWRSWPFSRATRTTGARCSLV